jgi:hypothetical protein
MSYDKRKWLNRTKNGVCESCTRKARPEKVTCQPCATQKAAYDKQRRMRTSPTKMKPNLNNLCAAPSIFP